MKTDITNIEQNFTVSGTWKNDLNTDINGKGLTCYDCAPLYYVENSYWYVLEDIGKDGCELYTMEVFNNYTEMMEYLKETYKDGWKTNDNIIIINGSKENDRITNENKYK